MNSQEEVISFCWNQSAGIPLQAGTVVWIVQLSHDAKRGSVHTNDKKFKKRLAKRFIYSSSEATRKQCEKFCQLTLNDF